MYIGQYGILGKLNEDITLNYYNLMLKMGEIGPRTYNDFRYSSKFCAQYVGQCVNYLTQIKTCFRIYLS